MCAQVRDPRHGEHEACWSSDRQGKVVKSKFNTHSHRRKGSTFTPVYNVQQEHPPITQASHIPPPAHTQCGWDA